MMKRSVRSKWGLGVVLFAALWLAAGTALAQTASAGGGADVLRIRKMAPVPGTKTPVFRPAPASQASAKQTDW